SSSEVMALVRTGRGPSSPTLTTNAKRERPSRFWVERTVSPASARFQFLAARPSMAHLPAEVSRAWSAFSAASLRSIVWAALERGADTAIELRRRLAPARRATAALPPRRPRLSFAVMSSPRRTCRGCLSGEVPSGGGAVALTVTDPSKVSSRGASVLPNGRSGGWEGSSGPLTQQWERLERGLGGEPDHRVQVQTSKRGQSSCGFHHVRRGVRGATSGLGSQERTVCLHEYLTFGRRGRRRLQWARAGVGEVPGEREEVPPSCGFSYHLLVAREAVQHDALGSFLGQDPEGVVP